jgi:hypothetical protein
VPPEWPVIIIQERKFAGRAHWLLGWKLSCSRSREKERQPRLAGVWVQTGNQSAAAPAEGAAVSGGASRPGPQAAVGSGREGGRAGGFLLPSGSAADHLSLDDGVQVLRPGHPSPLGEGPEGGASCPGPDAPVSGRARPPVPRAHRWPPPSLARHLAASLGGAGRRPGPGARGSGRGRHGARHPPPPAGPTCGRGAAAALVELEEEIEVELGVLLQPRHGGVAPRLVPGARGRRVPGGRDAAPARRRLSLPCPLPATARPPAPVPPRPPGCFRVYINKRLAAAASEF